MPMTRQRARSTFTFEVKRANKRTPESATLNKGFSATPDLAEQVFGKVSNSLSARTSGKPEASSSQRLSDIFPTSQASATNVPPARRVLPDLLSEPVDPVRERVLREEEDRAERRKATRLLRPRMADKPAPAAADGAQTPVAAESAAQERLNVSIAPRPALPVAETGAPASTQGHPKRKPLKARAMRAERTGDPLPRLPAGQRWKRRLPKACW